MSSADLPRASGTRSPPYGTGLRPCRFRLPSACPGHSEPAMLPSYFNDPRTTSSEAPTNPAPTVSGPIGWDRTDTTGAPDWASRPEGPAGARIGEFVLLSEL